MGIIMDILKDIPLSAVLRERLIEQESKMSILQVENEALKTENNNLKAQLQEIKKNQTIQGDICPYCRQAKGQCSILFPTLHLAIWV
jgi:hypothetical protein